MHLVTVLSRTFWWLVRDLDMTVRGSSVIPLTLCLDVTAVFGRWACSLSRLSGCFGGGGDCFKGERILG